MRSRALRFCVTRSGRRRRGAALLEAIVALTLLAFAAGSAIALSHQAAESVRRGRAAELAIRDASAFLEAVALWPREDLDRRLGDRAQGAWRLRIDRPTPTLYVVSLTDAEGGRVLLHTALYRPEAPRDIP